MTGGLIYLYLTLKGRIKPNKVTWFLWALAPMLGFAAEIYQGVGVESALTFSIGFGPLLVFTGSFVNKKAVWKISSLDIICGALSLLGLFLWLTTRIGNIAILFALLADFLAAVPTIRKSYFFPETESGLAYLLGSMGGLLTLFSISKWNFASYAFPVYILILNFLLWFLIKYKPKRVLS